MNCDFIPDVNTIKELSNLMPVIQRFPQLYRYLKLADYSIDDIINNRISFSGIFEFNDLFDSTFSPYKSESNMIEQIGLRHKNLEACAKMNGLSEMPISLEDYENTQKMISSQKVKAGYRLLEQAGAFICCFSECNNDILMWSHYSDSNKGICISFDFNKMPDDFGMRNALHKINYQNNPLIIHSLYDDPGLVSPDVINAMFTKSNNWDYEKEWRMFVITNNDNANSQRVKISFDFLPDEICFGYHFLKNYFIYNNGDMADKSKEIINLKNLLRYCVEKNIRTSMALPVIGKYQLQIKSINTENLLSFIIRNFQNDKPQDIRYYYVVQDELMTIIN